MYARINYVDIKPALFDECDDFWREVISAYPGMELGYFLQDGETAHTLSFIFFEDEAAMHKHNNDGAFAGVLRQAAKFRLCDPELYPMDVCAQLAPERPSDTRQARVVDVGFSPEKIDAAIAHWCAGAEPYCDEPGFVGAYLCCDRATGRARSVSFWESKADLDAHEQGDAFNAAVATSGDVIVSAPERSYWNVRVVV